MVKRVCVLETDELVGNLVVLTRTVETVTSVANDSTFVIGSGGAGSSAAAYSGVFAERPGNANVIAAFCTASGAYEFFSTPSGPSSSTYVSKTFLPVRAEVLLANSLAASSVVCASASAANVAVSGRVQAATGNVAALTAGTITASNAVVARLTCTDSTRLANITATGPLASNGYVTFGIPAAQGLVQGLDRREYTYDASDAFTPPTSTAAMSALFKSSNVVPAGDVVTTLPDTLLTGTPWRLYEYTGYLDIPVAGTYWLKVIATSGAGAVYLADALVAWTLGGVQSPGTALASPGPQRLYVQLAHTEGVAGVAVQWKRPGDATYAPVPSTSMFYDPALPSFVRQDALPIAAFSGAATFTGAATARDFFAGTSTVDSASLTGSALGKVATLAALTFRSSAQPFGERFAGVSADAVRAVLPEAVRGTGVSYAGVCALLVDALNELTARVEALETPAP